MVMKQFARHDGILVDVDPKALSEARKVNMLATRLKLPVELIRDHETRQVYAGRLTFYGFRSAFPRCPITICYGAGSLCFSEDEFVFLNLFRNLKQPSIVTEYFGLRDELNDSQCAMVFSQYGTRGMVLHNASTLQDTLGTTISIRNRLTESPFTLHLQTFSSFVDELNRLWAPNRRHLDSVLENFEADPREFILRLLKTSCKTQKSLATLLDCSSSFLNQVLRGKKPVPMRLLERANEVMNTL